MEEARTVDAGTVLVLLAEDEPAVRGLVKKILERAGFRVLAAEDGEAAWELAEALDHPLDLLVTDVVMPRLYGTELAARLAEAQPHLPTLFMSGYTDNERLRRGALDPGQAFLEKPFTPDELLRTARTLLAGARSAGAEAAEDEEEPGVEPVGVTEPGAEEPLPES